MPQVCTKVFASKIGTGVQTITGIEDINGVSFTPEMIMFFNTESVVNTLDWGDDFSNSVADNRGYARLGQGCGGSGADIGRFGVKVASTGASSGYSVLDLQADVFFGGNYQGFGYVSDIRDGEFDITWDQQLRGGYAVLCACFAGPDLDLSFVQDTRNGSHTTAANPKGVFFNGKLFGMDDVPGTALIGAGGFSHIVGWDVNGSDRATVGYTIANQGGNARGSAADRCFADLTTGSGGAWTYGATISSWGANSYTISGGTTSAISALAFCGSSIRCASGRFSKPATTGNQTVVTGIKAHWLAITTVGLTDSVSNPTNDIVNFSFGMTDGTRQGCFWVGESSGNVNPIKGARYLSDTEIVRYGTANAGSTTFPNRAELVEISPLGDFTINWTATDTDTPDLYWFALGEEVEALGTVQIDKIWDDDANLKQTTLQIGTVPGDDDVASQLTGPDGSAPLTLGPISIDGGIYYASEANQYVWSTTITGVKNGEPFDLNSEGQFFVANDDVIVITITNANNPPPERPKQWKLYGFNMKLRKEERA